MYHVYLLHCDKKTYIGMTDNPLHRLRQHNREIAGGARATAGHIWKHVCVLSGFPTRRSALQFEWMWKYCARRTHARSIEAKMETLSQIWKCDCSSSKSIHFSQFSTPFFLSFSLPLTEKLKKIESIQSLKLSVCGKQFQISDYVSFQLFPFPLISKMSSVSNAISVAGEAAPAVVVAGEAAPAVVAVVVEEKKKTQRKPKTAPVAEPAAESKTETKTEKPKEEKPKKEKTAATSDSEAPVEKKARKPKTAAPAAPAAPAASAAAPAPAPAPAPKEEKPKKTKKTSAAEPVAAEPVDAMAALRALLDMPAGAAPQTDAETTTDVEAAPKEKKPRKPRAKKTVAPATALKELDTATLDSLDMAGKVSLLKDHVLTLTQQVAALTARLESGVPASSDDESTGKKQRKKREPKAKAVCPAAAEGVIRFHTTLKNDYKPLSNSFKKDITIDGVVYPSVEHYYHCAKFLSTDAEYAEKIRTTANPALVKNMGRSKKVEARADWEAVHLDVMRKALQVKFSQHDDLTTLLRNTGAASLEEQSPSDAFWGIGADGTGTNQLGLLLAEIRATLMA